MLKVIILPVFITFFLLFFFSYHAVRSYDGLFGGLAGIGFLILAAYLVVSASIYVSLMILFWIYQKVNKRETDWRHALFWGTVSLLLAPALIFNTPQPIQSGIFKFVEWVLFLF
jgi:hypothetical protein